MDQTSDKSVRTESEWCNLFETQKHSGQSVASFCKEKSIPYSRFLYYRARLPKQSRLGQTNSSLKFTSRQKSFIPVEVNDENGQGVRVLLPRGIILEFENMPSVDWLRKLLCRQLSGKGVSC